MPAPEWFLADAVRVGLADGPLSDDERGAARQIAAHLGMTAAQAHGVIVMTEESAAAGLGASRTALRSVAARVGSVGENEPGGHLP